MRTVQSAGIVDHGFTAASTAPKTIETLLGTQGVKDLQGDDIVAARSRLEKLSDADRRFVFATPIGTSRMVPLLAAASRGATQMMALYAGMGAALDARTPAGFDSAYVALFNCKEDAARTMLSTKRFVEGMAETRPISAESVRRELDALPTTPTDTDLDALTDKLTTCGTKLLTNTQSLGLYLAHMNDATDSPFIERAEAWNPEGALEARTRSLVAMAAQEPAGAERDALIREIAAFTEGARLDRRIYSIGQVKDPGVAKLALSRECDRILAKLAGAVNDGNQTLTTLVIPVATPQHTMFLSLGPCYINGERNIVLHFDNRGAGYDAHTRPEGGKVYPIRTAVPANPEQYEALHTLLMRVLGQRGSGSVDAVYDGIKAWLTELTLELGPNGLEDPSWRELPEYPQVAGNCSLANQEPGVERRLGPKLAERFHAFEQQDVRRRLLASVTPERVDAWLTATTERRNAEHQKLNG